MTIEEQKKLIDAWVATVGDDMQVIVHVGHASAQEASGLARYAEQAGANAIAAAPPFYFKPADLPQLVDVMGQIAGGAPSLPFYYYHIPSMTGVNLPMWKFQNLATGSIPNLAGIKFTFEDLADYRLCLEEAEGREIFFGRDEMILGAIATGARSAVGSTFNLMPYIYHDISAAWSAGDYSEARRLQTSACRTIEIAKALSPRPAFKHMMALSGVDCGTCRRPLPQLSPNQTARLRSELERTPFRIAA